MSVLVQHSVDLILAHQAATGAYVAAPTFDTYIYCWLRDGSFIAHAMDRVGQPGSAAQFHRWVAAVLQRYDAKITHLLDQHTAGQLIDRAAQMHTRFTLDGQESTAEWTNFQLDGYGTWLWALADHQRRTGDAALYQAVRPQVIQVVRYLAAFWPSPCYDCWEEFGDKVHIPTLAAIFGGLRAIADYDPTLEVARTLDSIRAFIFTHGVENGHLIKFVGSRMVDASLLGAAVPYGLLDADDPRMRATVERIEADLHRGGVCRYLGDTYYGGGAWVLLAAWLGWHYAEAGDQERARALCDWVAAQADPSGALPEQVSHDVLAPEHYHPWVERWGPVATPLLWSHAMYLILEDALAMSAGEGAQS